MCSGLVLGKVFARTSRAYNETAKSTETFITPPFFDPLLRLNLRTFDSRLLVCQKMQLLLRDDQARRDTPPGKLLIYRAFR